jgi:hypothetical protein
VEQFWPFSGSAFSCFATQNWHVLSPMKLFLNFVKAIVTNYYSNLSIAVPSCQTWWKLIFKIKWREFSKISWEFWWIVKEFNIYINEHFKCFKLEQWKCENWSMGRCKLRWLTFVTKWCFFPRYPLFKCIWWLIYL